VAKEKFDKRPMASNIIALKVRQASSRVPFLAESLKALRSTATYVSSSRFQLKHVIPKKDFLLLGLSALRHKLFR
jgi:hypothetical protein